MLAAVYGLATGRRRTAGVLAALVASHWVLDFVTHRPDLPLYPGSAKYGLGLWNWVPATLVLEILLYAAGVAIYVGTTRARDRIGTWGFAALAGVLLFIYIGNAIGPLPPSVTAVAVAGTLGALIFTAWAWWVDHHQVSTSR